MHINVRLGMHCKVEKIEVYPMNISSDNPKFRITDELCSVDIAPLMICPNPVYSDVKNAF